MATMTMTETVTNTQQQNGVAPVSSPYQTGSEQPWSGSGQGRHGGGRGGPPGRSPAPRVAGMTGGPGGGVWGSQGRAPPPPAPPFAPLQPPQKGAPPPPPSYPAPGCGGDGEHWSTPEGATTIAGGGGGIMGMPKDLAQKLVDVCPRRAPSVAPGESPKCWPSGGGPEPGAGQGQSSQQQAPSYLGQGAGIGLGSQQPPQGVPARDGWGEATPQAQAQSPYFGAGVSPAGGYAGEQAAAYGGSPVNDCPGAIRSEQASAFQEYSYKGKGGVCGASGYAIHGFGLQGGGGRPPPPVGGYLGAASAKGVFTGPVVGNLANNASVFNSSKGMGVGVESPGAKALAYPHFRYPAYPTSLV